MVLAPKVGAVQGGKQRTLLDAPVLYGGGGGMDIFNDVWVYDAETQVWLPISPSAVVLDQRVTLTLTLTLALTLTSTLTLTLTPGPSSHQVHELLAKPNLNPNPKPDPEP